MEQKNTEVLVQFVIKLDSVCAHTISISQSSVMLHGLG